MKVSRLKINIRVHVSGVTWNENHVTCVHERHRFSSIFCLQPSRAWPASMYIFHATGGGGRYCFDRRFSCYSVCEQHNSKRYGRIFIEFGPCCGPELTKFPTVRPVRRNTTPAHIRKIPLMCRLRLVLRLGSVVSS